jgi:hypothetical protein
VHGRARRRFGHDQKLRAPGVSLDLGRQRGEAGRDFLVLVFAQDAQARSRDDLQRIFAADPSFTVVLVLVALLIAGGESLKGFVLALLIGIVSGTYSSVFNATPLLVVWRRLAGATR